MATRFANYPQLFGTGCLSSELILAELNTMRNYWTAKKQNIEQKQSPKREKFAESKKISFAPAVNIFKYSYNKYSEDLNEYETQEVNPLCHRDMPSAILLEQHIWHIITVMPWGKGDVGTREKLLSFIGTRFVGLTIEQIRQDMRQVYNCFSKNRPAILNFKKGIKLPFQYEEQQFDRTYKVWYKTGRKLYCISKLRRFLIELLHDTELASIRIQCAWRRYKARKYNCVNIYTALQ